MYVKWTNECVTLILHQVADGRDRFGQTRRPADVLEGGGGVSIFSSSECFFYFYCCYIVGKFRVVLQLRMAVRIS